MSSVTIRPAVASDWPFVVYQMTHTLPKYYSGDHAAHAKRIFETHIAGGSDNIGFFSKLQTMFIAEAFGQPLGLVHLVLKRQGTCKISPLIVKPEARSSLGVGSALLQTAIEFAKENDCRQLYCTVSKGNDGALRFFLRNGFIFAGKSKNQYMNDSDEYMLYLNIFEIVGDDEFDLDHISVLPMLDDQKQQVRDILMDSLPEDFIGIDDDWVDSLFDGFDRRHTKNVDLKYKLIFTASDRNGRVLGVAGATPKKGEPIKLMPFVAIETPAFFALLADVPTLLSDFGRKVYVHIIPDAEQTRFLQRAGWRLDGVMPDSYQVDRVTQQWSLDLDRGDLMKQMRLKNKYLDMMRTGAKSLEVRVAYDSVKKIKVGDTIAFLSREDRLVRSVKAVRCYPNFNEMLDSEDHQKIVPGLSRSELASLLHEIYPPNKEAFGVIVLEVA